MIYADYSYYSTEFGGTLIPEQAFAFRAARAAEYINRVTFDRINSEFMETDETAALKIKSCCCALAEADYNFNKNEGKASEKIGSYSVSYTETDTEELKSELNRIVDIYLGNTGLLYRGV